jgi:TRAP-type C4-dicarboxylate transport system substrate-binding protein
MNRFAAFALALCAVSSAVAQDARAAEAVTLKLANPGPPLGPVSTRIYAPLAERIAKTSDGEVEIKIFSGPTLANFGNVYDRVLNGVADIAFGLLGPTSASFPKSTVTALPFESPSGAIGSVAFWRMLQSGVADDEWQAVKLIAPMVFPPLGLHSRKPITTMADVRGTKMSAQTRPTGESIERLGGVPITMQIAELYQSLQRGIIEVATIGWPAAVAFKLPEIAPYHIEVPLGGELTYTIMNKDSYARLPAKGKKAFDDLIGESYSHQLGEVLDGINAENRAATAAIAGQTVSRLAPDEEARWKERVRPVTEAWVKATPDGARVLATYRAEVARAGAAR